MDIWIIRNGEKTGPFPDYEVRHRIQSEEIDGETRVWHEGLEGWIAISDLPLYQDDFRKLGLEVKSSSVHQAAPGEEILAPPPLPYQPSFVRRFWARWLDLHLYAALWWLSLYAAGRDIGSTLQNPWLIFSQYVPWFVLETLLIHRFATTPGKRLLGIWVINDDGSKLSLKAATWRSLRVLTIGIGLGWSFLSVFCQGLSLITARRLGRPAWDQVGGHRVTGEPLKIWKVATTVIGFIVAAQLQMAVIAPYAIEQVGAQFPKLKEHFENNPPWHLPAREQ